MSSPSKMLERIKARGVKFLPNGTRVSTPRLGTGVISGIEDYPGGYHLRYSVRLNDPLRWSTCTYGPDFTPTYAPRAHDPYFFPEELTILKGPETPLHAPI